PSTSSPRRWGSSSSPSSPLSAPSSPCCGGREPCPFSSPISRSAAAGSPSATSASGTGSGCRRVRASGSRGWSPSSCPSPTSWSPPPSRWGRPSSCSSSRTSLGRFPSSSPPLPRPKRHLEVDGTAVALHGHRDVLARFRLPHLVAQVLRAVDRLSLELHDHVSRLHAALRRGTILVHRGHEHTLVDLEVVRELARQLLVLDAELARP